MQAEGFDPVVAVAVETGATAAAGAPLVRLAAVRARDGEITDRFFAATDGADGTPGRPLEELVESFLDFVPTRAACLVHEAEPAVPLLGSVTCERFDRDVLETQRLARMVFPLLPSHDLDGLRERTDLPLPPGPRAASDAESVFLLWKLILERLPQLPAKTLGRIAGLLELDGSDPYAALFRWARAEAEMRRFGRGDRGLFNLPPETSLPRPRRRLPDPSEREALDTGEIAGLLGPGGPFAAQLPGYEYRSEQAEMARNVAEALNESRHLLVEAGTGVGKSIAYLLPSVLWSLRNDVPVVVSTNTKNLQTQLFEKDLPLIHLALERDFRAAVIKGRRNYLCLRKLFHLLRQPGLELEPSEAMPAATVLAWLAATTTGDLSESPVWEQPGTAALTAKLTSSREECRGPACRRRGECFLYRARRLSRAADIVIANHAVVFGEMGMPSPVLPPYANVVFDEAHNLEAAATAFFSVEVSRGRALFALQRLWRPRRRRSGTGVLASLARQTRSNKGAAAFKARIATQCEAATHAVEAVPEQLDAFMAALARLLGGPQGREGRRFRPGELPEETSGPLLAAKQELLSALARVTHSADALTRALREGPEDGLAEQDDLAQDLESLAGELREIARDIDFVLLSQSSDYVHWVEPVGERAGGVRAWAAPVDVGARLSDELYRQKDTVVFCSATLTVQGSTGFMRGRIGIDRVEPNKVCELTLGTPFDYRSQCLVLVPSFLPEPGEAQADYAAELGTLMAEICRRTAGRTMGLFTSYSMLRRTGDVLGRALAGSTLRVLAQGLSGSRESITHAFKRDVSSVLMGTHSFWEGVDIAGEALTCLVLARLPFGVHTDPVVAARCEQVEAAGRSAFYGYSLPSAVIRFRQGFGRLIRHRNDRGIVIVADRRIATKRYGQWFRRSIPARTVVLPDRAEFLDTITRFLEAEQG